MSDNNKQLYQSNIKQIQKQNQYYLSASRMDKMTNSLLQSIDLIAQDKIKNASFDKTILVELMECIDATLGKYKARYQDAYFQTYTNVIDNPYPPGTNAYVLVPEGNLNKHKTIIGIQTKTESNPLFNQQDQDKGIFLVGQNTAKFKSQVEQINLTSYHSETIQIYSSDSEQISNNLIDISAVELNEYLKNSSLLNIGLSIKTDLPAEQKFNGNYGIRYYIKFYDKSEQKNIVTRVYTLDIDTMTGNPYNFINWTNQKTNFSIDIDNFIEIEKIQIFVENFPNQRQGQNPDIFFKDFILMGANFLSQQDLDTYGMYFTTPKGYIFNQSSEPTDTREIIAHIKVKGQQVNNDVQKIPYYWFIKNASIVSGSPFYNKIAGQGWKCLNDYIVQEDENHNPVSVEFIPGSATLSVKKSDLLVKQNFYKCVAIYNNTIKSKEITILNFDSENIIIIQSTNGLEFNNDIGKTTLIAKILNRKNGNEIQNVKWVWNKKKKDGTTQNINNTDRIENISINEIDDYMTFVASAFDNNTNVLMGTSQITIVNNLNTTAFYTLVINNGSQLFKYDEWGISPVANEEYDIPELTFSIHDRKGQLMETENINISNVQWNVPAKDTMLTFSNNIYSISPQEGTNGQRSIIKGANNSNLMSLSYGILNNYFPNKRQNTIRLKVSFNNLTLIAQTNLTFIKQGDSGTNGTEYAVKLVKNYNNNDVSWGYDFPIEKPASIKTGNSDNIEYTIQDNIPFKLQFWHNGEKIYTEGTGAGENENTAKETNEGKEITITWRILRARDLSNYKDPSTWRETSIDQQRTSALDGIFYSNGYLYNSNIQTNHNYESNLIQATVKYDNLYYYAVGSMVHEYRESNDYRACLKLNGGFRQVVFEEDGRRPQYNNMIPFEVLVQKKIDNNWTDITLNYPSENPTYITEYEWSWQGSVHDSGNSWINECYLLQNSYSNNSEERQKNQCYLKVKDGYDGLSLNQAVVCKIVVKDNTNNILTTLYLHIPIHMMINRYGHQNLNNWDGNGITINNEGGYILSPQVGAGVKKDDNTFTGILIGKVKGQRGNTGINPLFSSNLRSDEEVGLFGYKDGQRSIFLDAETGKAQFGTSSSAQIILDPSSTAIIKSSAYDNPSVSDAMAINLSNGRYDNESGPWIKFKTGNFSVNKEGYLIAKGGGSIAGWQINDNAIYHMGENDFSYTGLNCKSENVVRGDISYENNGQYCSVKIPVLRLLTPEQEQTQSLFQYEVVGKAGAFWAGTTSNKKFLVTHDGYLKAQEASIGSGDKPIFIGKSSNDESAIFSGLKSSKNSNKNGFYLGTDGIGIGQHHLINFYKVYSANLQKWENKDPFYVSNFQVDSDGTFFATHGYIGTSNFGWQLERDFLGYNRFSVTEVNETLQIDKGIYFGVDGISMGRVGSGTNSNPYVPMFQVNLNNIGNTDSSKVIFRVGKDFVIKGDGLHLTGQINAITGNIGPLHVTSDKIYYYYNNGNKNQTNGYFNFEVTKTSAVLGPIYVQNEGASYIGDINDLTTNNNNNNNISISYPIYSYRKFIFYSDTQFSASANAIFNGYTEFKHQVNINSSTSFNINALATYFNKTNIFSGTNSKTYFQSNAKIYISDFEVKPISGYLGYTSDVPAQIVLAPTSSKRYKDHIRYLQKKDVEGLLKVQPALFIYKKESLKGWGERQGLYAQDLDKYYPNAVMYNAEKQPENWDPKEIIPGMLLLIQQHEKEIKRLKEIIENGK